MSNKIQDKLNYLNGTKVLIKSALQIAGAPITETTPFRNYADFIQDLVPSNAENTEDYLRIRNLILAHYYGDSILTTLELQQMYSVFTSIASIHME